MRRSHSRFGAVLLASTALSGVEPVLAGGISILPTGGSVASGSVTISPPSGNTLNIRQSSQGAIVNWQGFSIGQGNTVNIHQPGSSAALLNRVTGSTPSTIAGRLNANGQVYLVNPNGVAITKTGVVRAAGFVASTLGVSNEDFLSGRARLKFKGGGASKAVTNDGVIRVGRGGYAALIGGTVSNSGKILALMGKVGLGSGETATLDFSGNGFLKVAAPTRFNGKEALVSNTGTIKADGGLVVIEAATAREAARNAVNISGLVQARSIGGHSGAIVIGGGAGGAVNVSGRLDASSVSGKGDLGKGGRIAITGREIALRSAAVDVSGGAGGGKVRIGGGPQGTGKLSHAASVRIDSATTIKADATANGEGGSVVVWSDGATSVNGRITARGGASGGAGGAVETSGKTVDFAGLSVDTSAPRGGAGIWLIDPVNLTVGAAAANTISGNLASTNVTLQTTAGGASGPGVQTPGAGDITIASAISWSSPQSLTLDAYHAIAINAPVTIKGAGKLSLNAAADPMIPTLALLSFASGAGVQFTGAPNTGQALTINSQSYTLLYSMSDVLGVNSNLAGHYALAKPLDAAGTTYTQALIAPGGANRATFDGGVEGLGNTISNLTINAPAENEPVGLFGSVGVRGTIAHLGLIGGGVTGDTFVGGLVGENDGAITQSYVTGIVSGYNVGGLVGNNGGAIAQSYATGAVSSYDIGGGLVSVNNGRITRSYATGAVSGFNVGGLVGFNEVPGSITQSNATGMVSGRDYVGGLVGVNVVGSIMQSYATGRVSGYDDVGGLVGDNASGSITQSYATGRVSGHDYVGGLVGDNAVYNYVSAITQSYATGAVSGHDYVGGLVGDNAGRVGYGVVVGLISQSYATGAVSGTGKSPTFIGGLAGLNSGSIATSYWDKNTTDQTQGVGVNTGTFKANGLSTAQFVNKKNFMGWTFGATPGGSGWVIVDQGGTLNNAGGQAGATRPFLLSEYSTNIVNAHQLQLIALDTKANYTLGADIDLGPALTNPSEHWFTPANTPYPISGFNPIGQGGNQFTGTFDGQGHMISNLTIQRPTDALNAAIWTGYNVGLFGYVGGAGVVKNVTLAGGGVSGYQRVGALVGKNHGLVQSSSASVSVIGDSYIGGLVGWSYGSIIDSSASGAVNGSGNVGGLVGGNNFVVEHSYATGGINSPGDYASNAGGLVGANVGAITRSYATGSVSGNRSLGGLVGENYTGGSIKQSYATGNVSGVGNVVHNVGGLAGGNGGSISKSYATGAVSGANPDGDMEVGGLVGFNTGSINQSYAEGAVGATSAAYGGAFGGGLVGSNDGSITQSYATGMVNVGAYSGAYGGGLVGSNDGSITASYATGAVSGHGGGVEIGGLVGANAGVINNTYAAGVVVGTASLLLHQDIGGLVGVNDGSGSITKSYSTGAISGLPLDVSGTSVGGLVGKNWGSISESYETGMVEGPAYNDSTGGLVGINNGSISRSHATGSVSGGVDTGGLVGSNSGSITQSYATGAVTSGFDSVGGLVGSNATTGVIAQSYATGAVTGFSSIGGLVGWNAGSISTSYALGAVTGEAFVGGLVGTNTGMVSNSYSTGAVGGLLTAPQILAASSVQTPAP